MRLSIHKGTTCLTFRIGSCVCRDRTFGYGCAKLELQADRPLTPEKERKFKLKETTHYFHQRNNTPNQIRARKPPIPPPQPTASPPMALKEDQE